MMASMSLHGSFYVVGMPAVLEETLNQGAIVAVPPSRNSPTAQTADAEATALLRPRSTQLQYPGGVSLRWAHASAIADQAMYIFGGKVDDSNTSADYASACLALDLSMSFSVSMAPWSFTCAEKGPLVAGHSAIINRDINMIVLFGGTIPDGYGSDVDDAAPVHLFSAIIKSWSTPENGNFPQPLVNHSAVLHDATGDMIVYGGAMREDTSVLSNSTLRMVTDIKKHDALLNPPTVPFTNLWTSGAPSTPQSTGAISSSSSTRAATDPASASASSPELTEASESASESVSSDKATTATQSMSKTSSKSKSTPTTRSSSTSKKTSSAAKEPPEDQQPTKRAYMEAEATGAEDEEEYALLELERRFAKDTAREDEQLMAWTSTTLPPEVSGRVGHTASIVNETSMVVLGGSSGSSLVSMGMVFVYNSMDQTWVRRSATGAVPPSRRNHVATVVNNTLIVVHGGSNNDFTSAMGDVAVLDTATWKWSAPNVQNAPAARYAHAATQAGPYMIITFGYVLPRVENIADGDYGLYILDTSSWTFVDEFNAARSKLTVHYKSAKPTGGTIFGLFVASLVVLLVLLIMLYIGCMHYYNRHPRLSDLGETTTMLPSTELRNFGRKLTGRFGTRRYRQYLAQQKHRHQRQVSQEQNTPWTMVAADEASAKAPVPQAAAAARISDKGKADDEAQHRMYSSNNGESTFSLSNIKHLSPIVGSGDDTSLRIMFDLSRESSFDYGFFAGTNSEDKGGSANANDSRLSKRMHLDDVELPAGLRNRDNSQSGSRPTNGNARKKSKSKASADATAKEEAGDRASQELNMEHSTWSRPTTSGSTATRKSTHISAMLPRIVGSRLTLPTESATAVARYRFDELEEMPDTSFLSLHSGAGKKADQPAMLKGGAPATIGTLVTANDARSSNSVESLAPPIMPAAVGNSPAFNQRRLSNSSANSVLSVSTTGGQAHVPNHLRDSIDINAVFSQNHHFYVANPDN
ncbi:hypothetical protein IW140_005940 [Coemansia sp. RSA 1813]|nr:hypothetical protein IW138_006009 [Coemansia sp. RSA 986]KAJ2563878.1 hypothetical protein IW140_005940 [Coemansia sp. RSA 1813]